MKWHVQNLCSLRERSKNPFWKLENMVTLYVYLKNSKYNITLFSKNCLKVQIYNELALDDILGGTVTICQFNDL